MAIKSVEYKVKITNDPGNAAAAKAAADSLKQVSGGGFLADRSADRAAMDAKSKAATALIAKLRENTAAILANAAQIRAGTAADQQAIKVSMDRIAQIQRETTALQMQAAEYKKLKAVSTPTGGGGGGHGGGLPHGPDEHSVNLLHTAHRAMAAFLALTVGNEIMQMADEWAELNGKIKVNTESEAEAVAVRGKLIEMSMRTNTSLASNVESWEKMVNVGRMYGKSQNEILKIQETLFKGLRAGGATTQQAQNAMTQFIMVMNQGRGSGIAFNAIFRQSPELMNMLAKAMGKPISYFQKMGKEGSKAIEEILEAIPKLDKEVQEKFAKLPVTMKDGFQNAKTGMEIMIGTLAEKTKISGGMGSFFAELGRTLADPQVIAGVGVLANAIGSVLLVALNKLRDGLEYVRTHTEQVKAVFEVLTALLIGKAVVGVTQFLLGWMRLPAILGTVATALGFVNTQAMIFAAINPWTASIAAVVALGAALWVLGDNFDASGRHAYTAKDVIVGAFVGAKNSIVSVWSSFSPVMAGFFRDVEKEAKTSAARIAGWFANAFKWIRENAPGAYQAGANALSNLGATTVPGIGVWASYARVASNAIDAAGKQGRKIRAEAAVRTNLSNWSLDPSEWGFGLDSPLTGGAPLGSTGGGSKKKDAGSDRAKNAMQALTDYIEELKRATKEQDAMNAAILEGPEAMRQQAAQAAKSKAILAETNKLEKAGIDLKKNTAAAAKVAEAGEAAYNAELAKQRGERAQLSASIRDNTDAVYANIEVMRASITVWTADESQRQKRLVSMARELAMMEKMNEFKKKQWGDLTDAEKLLVNQAGDAAARQQIAKNDNDNIATFNKLLADSRNPLQERVDTWRAMGVQMEKAIEYLRMEGMLTDENAEKVRQYYQRIKPPENLFEALRSGLTGFTDQFSSMWTNISDGIKGSLNQIVDGFVDMAVTGKMNFKALARSVINDLLRMIAKALIFKAIMAAMNFIFPGSGTAAGAAINVSGAGSSAASMVSQMTGHQGGIAGLSLQARAVRRMHTGGLAGASEIPVIAKRGEAILPTVRMPDGNFGVKALTGGGGGSPVMFSPNININIDASKSNGEAAIDEEKARMMGQVLDEEVNKLLQRKVEEWMRPGGMLYGARRARGL